MEARPGESPVQARDRMRKALDALRAANFNIVLIDGWFKEFTAYPGSVIAPQYPPFRDNDMFDFVVEQAHQRGMKAQAWLGYGFYAYYTRDGSKDKSMGAVLERHPELAAVDSKGNKALHRDIGDFYSMCPSNPASHEILATLLVEMSTKYPVDGVHLDRIRYPEENYCFCDYCKEHFKTDTGIELREFAKGSAEARQLLAWRREQTAAAAKRFREAVHAARPGLPITAYVLSPAEMDSKAQGWDLWVRRGYVDAVSVSMYGTDIRQSAQKAVALLGESRGKLLCALSCERPTSVYTANIEVAREYAPAGQFTWWLGPLSDDLEALKAGPYARQAVAPQWGGERR
jgi:uncharacterized lipoprotein YddW (UPF0748 family)